MPLTLPAEIPVLIVGAGPTGIVAAIELARRGVDVRIVEMRDGPFVGSRAKGIQPRTLEVFEDLGIVEEVLASGGPFPRWRSYRGSELAWEKSIYQLIGIPEPERQTSIPFPETWMIAQWRTEEILRAALSRLGIEIEYATRLIALDGDDAGITATVEQRGQEERIRALYVLGADGAGSTTRKLAGVSFDGETREEERFVIADVRTGDLDRAFWHNWSTPEAPAERISICPLPHTDTFQFVAPIPADAPAPALTLDTLQALFDARSGRSDVRLTAAPWITLHRTNVRLAGRFRAGRVFLVGDAAHAPPAAGGQGLNLSVQDSYNLGWKLAAVLRGAPDALLDTYEQERRAVAARLLGVPLSVEDAAEKADIFQLKVAYRRSVISRETRRHPGTVRAGDRAPDAVVAFEEAPPRRLFELLSGTHFTCLAFDGRLASQCAAVGRRWSAMVDIRVFDVSPPVPPGLEGVRGIYGIEGDAVVLLIRPDGYVCFAADERAGDELDVYLRDLLGLQGIGQPLDALILLPGALLEPSEALLRRLGAFRRVIVPAYSDATRMSDLTDAIAGQMAAAGIQRADVLGSSYGGWVAQCLARRHPALVRRLILVHTFALRPDAAWRFRLALKIWNAMPGALLRGLMMARVGRMLRPLRDGSPGEHQRALANVRELIHSSGTVAALRRQNACMLDSVTSFPIAPGDLAPLEGKILIIESDDDPAIRAPERAHLRAMYPGAEVRTFHRTGHVTALVQPDEFVSAVNDFLTATNFV